MAGDLGALVISLTAETAQFRDALTKSAYQMDQSVGQMVASTKALEASLAKVDAQLGAFGINLRNVLGLASAGAFAGLIASSIDGAAHVQRLSQQTGIAADQLAAMKAAANAGGTTLDDVARASAKFSKALETQSEDSGMTAKALGALGLSMEELKQHSPAEQMHLVAERLNEFADGSGKAAAAQVLFGKSGTEILPFLKQYGEQVNLTKDGYAEYARQAEEFERSLGKLKAASGAVINQYAQELLPALANVVDGFVAMNSQKTESVSFMDILGEAVRVLALGLVTLWTGLKDLVALITGGAKIGFAALKGDMQGVVDASVETRNKLGANADALLAFTDKALAGSKAFGDTAGSIKKLGDEAATAKPKLDLNADALKAATKAAADLQKVIDDLNGVDQTYITRLTILKSALDSGKISQADYVKYVTQTIYAQKDVAKWTAEAQKAQAELDKEIDKAVGAAVQYHDALQKQIEQAGLSADAVAKLDAREKGLGDTEDANIDRLRSINDRLAEQQRALQDAIGYWQSYAAAQARARDMATDTLAGWAKGNDELVKQIRNLGLTKQQVELLAAADQYEADVNKAALIEDTQQRENYLAALKSQYDQRLALINSAAERQAYVDSANAAAKAYDDAAKKIDESLTNALYDGLIRKGQSFGQMLKSALETMFKNLVLRPILQPISNALAGVYQQGVSSLASLFGLGGSAGEAGTSFAGLLGNFGSIAQTLGFGGGSLMSAPAGASWAMPEGLGTTTTASGFGSSLGAVGLGALAGSALFSQFGARSGAAGALAGAGVVAGLAGSTGALATGAAAIATAAGATTATAAAVAAAVPVIGWVVAAAALLYNIFGSAGGGPKSGGSAMSAYANGAITASRGDFYTPNDADAKLGQLVGGLSTTYAQTVAALGGVAQAVSFGIGYDTDPQGTAQNRLSNSVLVNGQSVYGYNNLSLGRDSAVLQDRLNVEAQRMLLAAVQASRLPDDVAALIDAFRPADLGSEQIQNLLMYAQVFRVLPQQLKDALKGIDATGITTGQSANLLAFGQALGAVLDVVARDPLKDAADSIAQSSLTAFDKFHAMGDALTALAQKFDGSTAQAQALAQATQTYYTAQVQLLISLQQASAQFHQSIADTLRSMQIDTLSGGDRQSFYENEINATQRMLQAAMLNPATADPSQIQKWADLIKQDYAAIWSGLSDADKKAQLGGYSAQLTTLDQEVTDAMTKIGDAIKAANDPSNPNSPIGQVKSAFDGFMQRMDEWLEQNKTVAQATVDAATVQAQAADTQVAAASAQLTAAQTPITVTVVQGGGTTEAGS